MRIPDHLPTTLIDRSVLSWHELGLAEFMLQIEMEFDCSLDADRLARALDLLLDAEPVLGCRLATKPILPYWKRVSGDERKIFSIAAAELEYDSFRVKPIDFTSGPQVKACLFRAADGDRLLLKVSHIAADAGGTKETAARLADIYSRLGNDPHYIPEPNLRGDRGIAQLFRQVPIGKIPVVFSDFLRGTWTHTAPPPTLTLPLPEIDAHRRELSYTVRSLDVERTTALSAYGRERHATLNDMVIAAAFRALAATAHWDGSAGLFLQMTFDYRRWYLPFGHAGGICNLSGFEYPTPGSELGTDFEATLARISTFTRRRKERMPGLAIAFTSPFLMSLPYFGLKAFFKALEGGLIADKNHPDTFTNMGPIEKETLMFGKKPPRRAWMLVPPIYPPIFGFGMSGYAGSLTLSSGGPRPIMETAENFLDALMNELPS